MGFASLCPSYDHPYNFGDVAQLVEHLLCKQGVVGSIPSISTRFLIWAKMVRRIYRENRVSIFWFRLFLQRSGGEESWMFAPSLVVEEQKCSFKR